MTPPRNKQRLGRLGQGLCGLLGLLASTGCDDIIEPDITQDRVELLTPGDSARTTSVVQTFRWEPVLNARSYRFQLASPSFAQPTRVFRDSALSQAFFTTTVAPGTYQWRVKAVNGSYETAFTTRALVVDTTSSLTGQVLRVTGPAAGAVTNAPVVTFRWTPLSMAQRYRLYLTPNPRTGGPAALDTLLGDLSAVSLRLPRTSRVYQWKVIAANARSTTESMSRALEIDVTPPPAPTLGSPAASETFLALPITLSWTRTAPDVVQDSVFFYQPNQTTLFPGFPRLSSATSLSLASPAVALSFGTYYWSVRSIDRAGNLGPATAKRPFTMQ